MSKMWAAFENNDPNLETFCKITKMLGKKYGVMKKFFHQPKIVTVENLLY